MNSFIEKHNDETMPYFQISNQFIKDFIERNYISSRCAHPKPHITSKHIQRMDGPQVNHFKNICDLLLICIKVHHLLLGLYFSHYH